jgi:hypothetical protein
MKVSLALVMAFVASASGFVTPSASYARAAAQQLSMSSVVESPFIKPEKIVMSELPSLYVYDHCPFCVRVRLALGLKNVKYNLQFLANDDVATPTALVGKKIAPIFVSLVPCCPFYRIYTCTV